MRKPARKEIKFKRLCLGCTRYFFKEELIKITYANDSLTVDTKRVISGHSFYLCSKKDCLKEFSSARKKHLKKLKFINQTQIEKILSELRELIPQSEGVFSK